MATRIQRHLPERVEIKALKIADHLSEETLAFTCSVYLDGKKVGQARNDGRGGCNRYDIQRSDLSDLEEIALEWYREEEGEEAHSRTSAMDMMLSALTMDYEDRQMARANGRRNYPVTLHAMKGWRPWKDGATPESGDGWWEEEFYVGLPSEDAIDTAVAKHGIDAYVVVHAEEA